MNLEEFLQKEGQSVFDNLIDLYIKALNQGLIPNTDETLTITFDRQINSTTDTRDFCIDGKLELKLNLLQTTLPEYKINLKD